MPSLPVCLLCATGEKKNVLGNTIKLKGIDVNFKMYLGRGVLRDGKLITAKTDDCSQRSAFTTLITGVNIMIIKSQSAGRDVLFRI